VKAPQFLDNSIFVEDELGDLMKPQVHVSEAKVVPENRVSSSELANKQRALLHSATLIVEDEGASIFEKDSPEEESQQIRSSKTVANGRTITDL